jgi:hypothetical protein|tara:strand:- start:40 stop:567 length:528 start_codon:yes stop_codon:yes gene_type:complete
VLALTFSLSSSGNASPGEIGSELSVAIADFNKKALSDSIGVDQTPLTEAEVIAAILLWEREADTPVSDELFASFKRIAEDKILPGNAEFEKLTGYDRGGSHVFDVWSVRIRMDRPDGSSYAFRIRERTIGSRTLPQELARLNRFIKEKGVERWVGGHDFLERKKSLEERIKREAR